VNARSLRQRERLKGAKRAVAEDGIDLADHETILAERCHVVEIATRRSLFFEQRHVHAEPRLLETVRGL
jgi:hypothetical protein